MLVGEEIQSRLPAGLVLKQSRTVHACQGQLFDAHDFRFTGGQSYVRRIIRVLKCNPLDPWRGAWLASIKKLFEQNLTGICRPLEIAWIGSDHCYLVFDWFPSVLADQIPHSGVKQRGDGWVVFEQIVRAVSALHCSFGPHGDLRAENIFLNAELLGDKTRAWVAQTDLAGLPKATDSELLCPDSRKLFPPEWSGELKHADKSADVYALGILAVRILLGSQGVESFLGGKQFSRSQKKRIGWLTFWWVVSPMLRSHKQRRFQDAAAVQRRLCQLRYVKPSVQLAATIIAVALLHCGLFLWHLNTVSQQRADAEQKAVDLKKRLEDREQQIKSLRSDNELLKSENQRQNAAAVRSLSDDEGQKSATTAQELWRTRFIGRFGEDFTDTLSSVEAEENSDVTPEVTKLIKEYHKSLDVQRADWESWVPTLPAELTQSWNTIQARPWEETAKHEAVQQLTALSNAREIWNTVIGRKARARQELSWDEFQKQLEVRAKSSPSSERVSKVINTWIDQFNGLSGGGKKVILKVRSGKSPVGSGLDRTYDIFVTDSYWAGAVVDDEKGHTWKSETEHVYDPPLPISFEWQCGQPIFLRVYGYGAVWRPTYVAREWSGPVALWHMANDSPIKSGEHEITLEIEGLPGPPPRPRPIVTQVLEGLILPQR